MIYDRGSSVTGGMLGVQRRVPPPYNDARTATEAGDREEGFPAPAMGGHGPEKAEHVLCA